MSHPSEAGHFYYPDGTPCYEIKGANGKMRPTTVRDARKLGLVPSVTTVIRCADRPGLNYWLQQQVLLAALTLPRLPAENDESFCKRVMEDSKEQAKAASERGTAIHAALEKWFSFNTEGNLPPEMHVTCREVGKVVSLWEALPDSDFDPEKSFAHPSGFGGKVDIHGEGWVADFKTKEFGPEDELKFWDEHAMQLAAYRVGLGLPTARCAIVYVSVTHPGVARLLEIPEQELARGWECFRALLSFWQAKNKHSPEKMAA